MTMDRPILFSAPMVRAILDGTKRQTRRVVKDAPGNAGCGMWCVPQGAEHKGWTGALFFEGATEHSRGLASIRCPYGAPGDRLWVRETLKLRDDGVWHYGADDAPVTLPLSHPSTPAMVSWAHHKEGATCVSIHMPRWASRITLAVELVRVERLQTISEEDARAEGVDTSVVAPSPTGMQVRPKNYANARDCFADLWREINGAESWEANPWVWVIGFSRVESPNV